MMEDNKKIGKEVSQTTINLLSLALPYVSIPNIMRNGAENIANILLIDKINRFLSKQDHDFEEKLKISSKFTKDDRKYKKNVKLIIHNLNSINDDYKIDVYANLTRARLCELLCEDTYLRLTFILSNLHYGDLEYLKENISRKINVSASSGEEEPIEVKSLVSHGLIDCINKHTWGALEGDKTYMKTNLGLEMVRCGIDYENYHNYKD
ncbi:MAG: hypothetical protein FWE04_01410 [Oscillospiraceae bacterium]|nr:hypothetical protein [Oscillospiraceae bacterium]